MAKKSTIQTEKVNTHIVEWLKNYATNAKVKVGDEAEIIGPNCPLEKMAELLGTIPYEVMTSISERVHKVYVE